MRQRRLHPLLGALVSARHRGRGLSGGRGRRELRPERRPARDPARVRRAHLGVVRGDDRCRDRACRPTAWPPTARRASRRRRRTSARTCGARSSRNASGSSTTTRRSRAWRRPWARSRRWSATRRAASTTTGTTTRTARSSPSGRRVGDPVVPILSSVDNGWLATGIRVVATASRSWPTRAGALFDSMDFGFYYRPERQPDRVPLHARAPAQFTVLLRHDREREPDRELHRDRQGRDPGEGVLRRLADVPRDLRLELARDQAGRRSARPISASTSSKGPTRTRTSESSRAGAGACSRR